MKRSGADHDLPPATRAGRLSVAAFGLLGLLVFCVWLSPRALDRLERYLARSEQAPTGNPSQCVTELHEMSSLAGEATASEALGENGGERSTVGISVLADVPVPDPLDMVPVKVVYAHNQLPVPGATLHFMDSYALSLKSKQGLDRNLNTVLQHHGQELKCNDHGVAYLPRSRLSGYTRLLCEHGDLIGQSFFHHWNEPEDLWLYPKDTIKVRVLDVLGSPVERAQVGVRCIWDKTESESVAVAFTDSEGWARLEGWREDLTGFDPARDFVSVAVLGLWDTAPELRFEPSEWPKQVSLTMPACVGLDVLVLDEKGEPYEAAGRLRLDPVKGSTMNGWNGVVGIPCEAGRASFSQLSPGMEFVLRFDRDEDYASVRVQGKAPTQVGAIGQVLIQLGKPKPKISGLAKDPSGAALSEIDLEVTVFQSNHEWRDTVRTDAEGHFRFGPRQDSHWPNGESPVRIRVFESGMDPEQIRERFGYTSQFIWTQEDRDLGECRLEELPLLVSGMVVGHEGHPQSRARLRLIAAADGSDEMKHLYSNTLHTYSDSSGRFQLHGWPNRFPAEWNRKLMTTLKLLASSEGHSHKEKQVALGATGVILELVPSGAIEGFVLLDDVGRASDLQVWCEQDGEEKFFLTSVDSRGRFRETGMSPGAYDVTLCIEGEPEFGWLVNDVQVASGVQKPDPRLMNVDLRGRIHQLDLEVLDQRDQPVTSADAFRFQARGAGVNWFVGESIDNGRLKLFSMQRNPDLVFRSREFATQVVRRAQPGQRVVLADRPCIELQIKGHSPDSYPWSNEPECRLTATEPYLPPWSRHDWEYSFCWETERLLTGQCELPVFGVWNLEVFVELEPGEVVLARLPIEVLDQAGCQRFAVELAE